MNYKIHTTPYFEQWLSKLKDKQAIRAIGVRLLRAESGHLGDIKPVGGAVSEMRIFVGRGYRLYFTIQGERLVVMLAGGDKSSQARDIERAKAILKDLE